MWHRALWVQTSAAVLGLLLAGNLAQGLGPFAIVLAHAGSAGPDETMSEAPPTFRGLPPAPRYKPGIGIGPIPDAAANGTAQVPPDDDRGVADQELRARERRILLKVQSESQAGGAAPGDLEQIARFLPGPGEWSMLPGTAVRDRLTKSREFAYCDSIACFNSANAFDAWNTMSYDPAGHHWYNCAGGGHADYGGNECYRFDLKRLAWDRITEPAPLAGPFMRDTDGDGLPDACPMPAEGPPSAHTYDGVVWLPQTRELMWLGTSGYCSNEMGTSSAWTFRPSAMTWARHPQLDHLASYARTGLDPQTGNPLVFSKNRLHEVDAHTKQIIGASSSGPDLGEGSGAFHPGREEFYLTAYGELWQVAKRGASYEEPSKVADLPDGMSNKPGIVHHPVSGQLIFWDGDERVWSYDPAAKHFDVHSAGRLGPTRGGSRGVYGKWIYVAELDSFAGYNNVDEGVWIYRLPGARGNAKGPGPRPEPEPFRAQPPRRVAVADLARSTGMRLEPAGFDERCRHPDVVLCDPLDSGRVSGLAIGPETPNTDLPSALRGKYRDWRWVETPTGATNPAAPVMDPQVKVSGTGSLKFTILSNSDANDAGYLQTNFTPDNSVQFGEGDTFFVQWRQRFSCSLLYTDCAPDSPGFKRERRRYRHSEGGYTAFKTVIINAGDHEALEYPVESCTQQHIVLNHGMDHATEAYHSCGWYEGFDRYLDESVLGSRQIDFQPGGGAPCRWMLRSPDRKAEWGDSDPGCSRFEADEWMAFQAQISVGTWQPEKSGPPDSNFKLWVAREGEPSRLVFDFDFHNRGPEREEPFKRYGKIWLLPYMTKKDPGEAHPTAYTWYDELIVSRSRIPDPK